MINEEILRQIGEQFGDMLARNMARFGLRTATVERVTEDRAYVSFFEGDQPIAVPLAFLRLGASNILVKPTVGSLIAIGFLDANMETPYIVACEKIDSVEFRQSKSQVRVTIDPEDDTKDEINVRVGDSTIRVAQDVIELNCGSLGGLVKIAELERNLNSLKRYCEQLKSAVVSGFNSVGVGSSASGPNGATATNAAMAGVSIRFDDMEYEKIKQ